MKTVNIGDEEVKLCSLRNYKNKRMVKLRIAILNNPSQHYFVYFLLTMGYRRSRNCSSHHTPVPPWLPRNCSCLRYFSFWDFGKLLGMVWSCESSCTECNQDPTWSQEGFNLVHILYGKKNIVHIANEAHVHRINVVHPLSRKLRFVSPSIQQLSSVIQIVLN